MRGGQAARGAPWNTCADALRATMGTGARANSRGVWVQSCTHWLPGLADVLCSIQARAQLRSSRASIAVVVAVGRPEVQSWRGARLPTCP